MKKIYMVFLCLCLIFSANFSTSNAMGLNLRINISQYQSLEQNAEEMSDDKILFCRRRSSQLMQFLSCEENFYHSHNLILKNLDQFLLKGCTLSEHCWLSLARTGVEMIQRIKALAAIYYYMCFENNDISVDLSWAKKGYVRLTGYIHKFEKKERL